MSVFSREDKRRSAKAEIHPLSPDYKAFHEELRNARDELRQLFDERVQFAQRQVNTRTVTVGAILVAALVAIGSFGPSIIRTIVTEHYVRDSVQDVVNGYTANKIDVLVREYTESLEKQVKESQAATSEIREILALVRLKTLIEAGREDAYIELKRKAETSEDARTFFASAEEFFAQRIQSKSHNTINEMEGDYKKVSLPPDELVERIRLADEIDDEILNLVKNVAYETHQAPLSPVKTSLLLETALKTTNLLTRAVIVDCIHAKDEAFPRTVDSDILRTRWRELIQSTSGSDWVD